MSRVRTALLAAIAALFVLGTGSAAAQVVVSDFSSDPTRSHGNDPVFFLRGPGAGQFVHEPSSPPRFSGDARGSLAVTYDSLAPTSRFFTTLPGGFTQDDDFVFGAVITIRPDGFAADPFGFHPIAFSLFNSATTGDDRTGDLSDFSADTFDTLEFAYFPNVSPFFGGPFLSPDVFSKQVAPDAFAGFAFGSVEFNLQTGVTYLVELEHSATSRAMTAKVSFVRGDGAAIALPGGTVRVDLSRLEGFLVDSLGISA
ncbi:MAG TPA: hypothetical protein VFE84_03795, partial [Patescibacteria group bacterium]|nr:hypothetical protein [Patescibacteria group bacterium]